jgi:hypothetical protein
MLFIEKLSGSILTLIQRLHPDSVKVCSLKELAPNTNFGVLEIRLSKMHPKRIFVFIVTIQHYRTVC